MTSYGRVLGLAAAMACLAAVTAGPAAAQDPCPTQTKAGKPISFTDQVYCWVAYERKSRKLYSYKKNKKLAGVALAHSKRMEKANVFNHTVGGTVFKRVKKSGYFKGAKAFGVGETITWVKPGGSARAALDQFLASTYHRGVIRNKKLKDFGIGVVEGSPVAGKTGGYTVTGVYGRRK